jgi:hypothetical protein
MPHSLALALCVLAAVAVPTGAAPVPKGAERKPLKAAYVHIDEKHAEAFKKLLDGQGFVVELVAYAAVGRTDFTKYDLILIGSDTEQPRQWGDTSTIEKSGKPVLGLGEGGYQCFGTTGLNLAIGAPHGWHGFEVSVAPVDAKDPFWKALGVEEKKVIELYKKTEHDKKTGNVGVFLPDPPADVVLLGREIEDLRHYAIVQQGTRYVFWGFTAGPDDMTADGRKVFVATCRYTAQLARGVGNK